METNFTSLDAWLAYCESLHPKNIDLGLQRVRAVAQRMALHLPCPVITVAGTNGKGSTCAMLESILGQAGYKTGVYSSPHLVHFVERLRLQGHSVQADVLLPSFACVESARCQGGQEVSLTYFEFTTLAILHAMSQAGLDVAILEVGLGGRLDATNIVDTDCAVITSIDLDHMEFLGSDRESIGREKAGIMRAGKPVVVSDPVPPQSVLDYAAQIGANLWRAGRDFSVSGDKQQWSWVGRATVGGVFSTGAALDPSVSSVGLEGQSEVRRYSGLAYPALRGANQLVNAAGVLAALTALREQLPVTAQAIRNGLAFVELPGRFQIIPGAPTLVLDVAHNPHSVAALGANLDAMGFYPRTHAVFGAMADKDLVPMLDRLMPLLDAWYFSDLPTPRAASATQLQSQWQARNTRKDAQSSVHANPVAALEAALAAADPADRIVVFGSFYTVGGVLQHGVPRLHAKHLKS